MSKDGWKRFKTGSNWRYDVSELGYKCNITDLATCFGNWQFQFLNEWSNRREFLFNFYIKAFKDINGIVCPNYAKATEVHAFHLFIIKIIPTMWQINRDDIIILLNNLGIGTSVHYIPIHMHSYYVKKYGYKASDYPKAAKFSDCVISLPLYPRLKDNEVKYISENIQKIWEKYKI